MTAEALLTSGLNPAQHTAVTAPPEHRLVLAGEDFDVHTPKARVTSLGLSRSASR